MHRPGKVADQDFHGQSAVEFAPWALDLWPSRRIRFLGHVGWYLGGSLNPSEVVTPIGLVKWIIQTGSGTKGAEIKSLMDLYIPAL